MANYVAHYTKRLHCQKSKEEALRRFVKRGTAHDKLVLAAEEVRVARIHTLKAKLATLPPADNLETAETDSITKAFRRKHLAPIAEERRKAETANIAARIDELLAESLDAILAEFGFGG